MLREERGRKWSKGECEIEIERRLKREREREGRREREREKERGKGPQDLFHSKNAFPNNLSEDLFFSFQNSITFPGSVRFKPPQISSRKQNSCYRGARGQSYKSPISRMGT